MSRGSRTLNVLWQKATWKYASSPLVISDKDDSVFLYEDAEAVVKKLVAKLQTLGFCKGDTLCYQGTFHAESVFTFWACACLGAVLVPVDAAMPRFQLDRIIEGVKPKLIISDLACYRQLADISAIPLVVLDEPTATPIAAPYFSAWLDDGPASGDPWPEIDPEDPLLILHTSGTTGAPKGVVHAHGALYRSGLVAHETFGWQPGDIILSLGEPHAMMGLRNPGVACLHAGAAFVEASFETRNSLFLVAECIERRRCTLLGTSPTLVRHLCEHIERVGAEALASLRTVMCTGSPLSWETAVLFEARYGAPVHDYYGLTETAGICIANPVGRKRQPDSIGVPVGCRARIVDDDGRPLAPGQVGELLIESDSLMSGYFEDRALTDEVIKDGWFHTGDLARISDDGHVTLMGRKRDIVKNAYGDLIQPAEVEAILELHPLVDRAGVCGYTSQFGDERLAAFLVVGEVSGSPAALFADLREHVTTHLGNQKVPQTFRIIDALPVNTNGKLLRQALAEEL